MPKQKQTQPRPKTLYRVKNWMEYDKALVQRGSITCWIADDAEQIWLYTGEKQRGSQFEYSDQAILMLLTVKEVFHLTNRSVEGFMRSIFQVLKSRLRVPEHSTLSRRGNDLNVKLTPQASGSLDIVMDSTGLKIYSLKTTLAKVNGRYACMANPGGAPGANCMSGLTQRAVTSTPQP